MDKESLLYGISTVSIMPDKRISSYIRKHDVINYSVAAISQLSYTSILMINILITFIAMVNHNDVLAYLAIIIIAIMSLLPLTSAIILTKIWKIKE